MSRRAIASGGFRVVVPVQRVALAVAVAWEGEGQEGQGAGHGQGGQGGHPESFHNSSHGSGISGSFRGSHGHNGRSDGNAHNVSDSEAHPNSPPNNDIWISEVLVLNEKSDLRLDHTQDQNSQNTSQKRSLGLQKTESHQKAPEVQDVQGSERKLRTGAVASKTVSILQEPELPKNEFTTSVQMHVQVDEFEQPSDAKDTFEMPPVQKSFSYGTEKTVTSLNIVKMKNPPIAETDTEMPNASKGAFRSEDPMTIAFLSPSSSWPKRSDLGTSLKTCFAALLAAVILALKINKVFSFFQCCKGFRTSDWESYDYDQLPQLPQLPLAESWWERSEREETERNDRNDRETPPETEKHRDRSCAGGAGGAGATADNQRTREQLRILRNTSRVDRDERAAGSAASNPGAACQRPTPQTSQSQTSASSETQRLRSQKLKSFLCSDCFVSAHSRHRLSDYHRFINAQLLCVKCVK